MLNSPLFTIGDTQTTVGSLLIVIAILTATYVAGRFVSYFVKSRSLKLDEKDVDVSHAYGVIAKILVWFVGMELALHLLGIQLFSFLAASGFIAIGAGFAAKNVIDNFLSGIILRLDKTVRPDDVVITHDRWLVVQHIGLRTTKATTYDGEEIIIPNSNITQTIVQNVTRSSRSRRVEIKVGVAYESDLALVRKTLEETVNDLEWISENGDPPVVYLDELGDSSVNYIIFFWIDDINDILSRKSELYEAIWWVFKEKDIRIAYPQLDVHLGDNMVDADSKQQ